MRATDPFLCRLPADWQAALRDEPMGVMNEMIGPAETTNRRKSDEPVAYIHTDQLQALVGRLKQERLRRGLSLADVARVTNQARSAISRLENGLYPNPTLDTVCRYASALGMGITLSAEPLRDEVEVDVPEVPDPE